MAYIEAQPSSTQRLGIWSGSDTVSTWAFEKAFAFEHKFGYEEGLFFDFDFWTLLRGINTLSILCLE